MTFYLFNRGVWDCVCRRHTAGGLRYDALVRLQVVASLLEDLARVAIFFADHVQRIVIKEPAETAVFSGIDADIGLMRLREK